MPDKPAPRSQGGVEAPPSGQGYEEPKELDDVVDDDDSKQVLVDARANLEVAVGESPNIGAGLHHRALPCFHGLDRCHLVDF